MDTGIQEPFTKLTDTWEDAGTLVYKDGNATRQAYYFNFWDRKNTWCCPES